MQARSVTSYTVEQLDALWLDCRAHIVGGTMPHEDATHCRSEVFNSMNRQPIKMAVSDDDNKDISYLTGYKTNDDHFFVVSGLHGKDTSGSKGWLFKGTYWSTIKQYLVDNNLVAYAGEMLKDRSAYNHVLTVSDLNLYPGATFSTSNLREIPSLGFTTINICFLHN